MKEIVTLSGDIGGGKSSVARILSASLGYPIISAGGMQREIAASMGLTTLQLNEQSAKDRSVDDRIDAFAGSWHSPVGKNVLHIDEYYAGVTWKATKLNRLQGFLGGAKRP